MRTVIVAAGSGAVNIVGLYDHFGPEIGIQPHLPRHNCRGQFTNDDDSLSPVVHQYDRFDDNHRNQNNYEWYH